MKCFWCLVTKLDGRQCENQKSSVADNDLRHLIEKEKRKIAGSGTTDETKSFEKPKNKANNFLHEANPGSDIFTKNNEGTIKVGESSIFQGNCNVHKVTISNDMAGEIIGQGGSRISGICSNSKARITIDEPVQGWIFLWILLAHWSKFLSTRIKF